MIRLYLNNELIDIDQGLSIEKNSPFFGDEIIGDHSYPVGGPMSPLNKRLLGDESKKEVIVDTGCGFFKKCELNYKVNDRRWIGFLKLDLGTVIEKLRKPLRELITDQVVFNVTSGDTIEFQLNNYNTLPVGQYPVVFFPIKNDKFINSEFTIEGEVDYANRGYMNFMYNIFFKTDLNTSLGVVVRGYHIVPQINLVWLLRTLIKNLGYQASGPWIEDEEVKTWTIYSNVACNWETKNPGEQRFVIDVFKHLPNVTFAELLKALTKDEGVGLFINNSTNSAVFKSISDLISETDAIDLRGTELTGWQYESIERRGYKIKALIDEKDEIWKEKKHISSFDVDEAENEIELSIGTLMMITEPRPGNAVSGNWVIPATTTPGNITNAAYRDANAYCNDDQKAADWKNSNEAKLILLSYRGMQPDTEGILYPYATSVQTNAQGTVVGKTMRKFEGPTGRFYTTLSRIYGYRSKSRPLTATLLIPATLHNSISLSKKIILTMDRMPRKFMIQQIAEQYPVQSGKILCKMKLMEVSMKDIVAMQATTPGGELWIVLSFENFDIQSAGPFYTETYADVVIRVYSDEDLSTPAFVPDLQVLIKIVSSDAVAGTEETITVSTFETFIATGILIGRQVSDSNGDVIDSYDKTYTVLPSLAYNIG